VTDDWPAFDLFELRRARGHSDRRHRRGGPVRTPLARARRLAARPTTGSFETMDLLNRPESYDRLTRAGVLQRQVEPVFKSARSARSAARADHRAPIADRLTWRSPEPHPGGAQTASMPAGDHLWQAPSVRPRHTGLDHELSFIAAISGCGSTWADDLLSRDLRYPGQKQPTDGSDRACCKRDFGERAAPVQCRRMDNPRRPIFLIPGAIRTSPSLTYSSGGGTRLLIARGPNSWCARRPR
jgi:hypothetical protein